MKISARVEYGIQAMLVIASKFGTGELVSAESIANDQEIPYKFLEGILGQLKRAGLLLSHRGSSGGYELSQQPDEITIADVVRAIDGPLASVKDLAPEEAKYKAPIGSLTKVWIATRVGLREVLEEITLADVLADQYSSAITKRITKSDAWRRRR